MNFGKLQPIRLLSNATFNLASVFCTLGSVCVLAVPALFDISLSNLQFLHLLEILFLTFFLSEALLRILVYKTRYVRSPAFWIELVVVLPFFLEIALLLLKLMGHLTQAEVSFILAYPGLILVRGFRVLRFLEGFEFFYQQKRQSEFSGGPIHSPIFIRLFADVSLLLFVFIMAGGTGIAFLHHRLVQSEKAILLEQVANYAETYGLQKTYSAFPDSVIRVEKRDFEESYELFRLERDYVKRFYRYGHDFLQLDGVVPGGNVQISFRHLNRRQHHLELGILGAGVLVLAALYIGLHLHLNRLILEPVDRARRNTQLRLLGEELASSEIGQDPYTEIVALVNETDQLYNKLRAPRRKLLTDQTERPDRGNPKGP